MKFPNSVLFENVSRITDTLPEDLCTFMIISCRFILVMKRISDKRRTEHQNTHFMFNIFFPPENRAVYEISWKTMVEPGIP